MPYPSEHACRIRDPGDFDKFRRVNADREHDGKKYDVIYGKLEGSDKWEEQAYRYPKGSWEPGAARSHCKSHGGSFEAASDESAMNAEAEAAAARTEEEPEKAAPPPIWGRVEAVKSFVLKAAEGSEGWESMGLVSTSRPDRVGDEVDQESLRKALKRWLALAAPVVYNHEWDVAIGKGLRVWPSRDVDGTMAHLRYARGVSFPFKGVLWNTDEIVKLLWQEIGGSHSYAYDGERKELGKDRIGLTIHEVFEVSVVTIPMNPEAVVTAMKARKAREPEATPPPEEPVRDWQDLAEHLSRFDSEVRKLRI